MHTLARQKCTAEIARRLLTVRPGSVARWGRMSAHQMVCHLADSFRMMTGDKPVSAASSRIGRTLVKWTALYLPVRWPTGLPTRPEIDQQGTGTRPVDFARDLAEVTALLELVATRRNSNDWPVHPIFGRMSQAAWLRWAYLHIDHHLRQFGA